MVHDLNILILNYYNVKVIFIRRILLFIEYVDLYYYFYTKQFKAIITSDIVLHLSNK